jgi:nucleotide-binding universal stress UspA family protein
MKTIVALVDFSDLTFKILKEAHTLAKAFGSHVVILHVITKHPVVIDAGLVSPTVMEDPSPERIGEDEAHLLELRDSLEKFGVQASVRQIQAENVEQVLDEARNLEADLIIVGSHRHGKFYNLLVGSVTEHVLRHAPCPVVVVPAVPMDSAG